ncbi:MAG: branched-chain amino acid ABC transporter substrate-binding protein [Candidatus Aminicenantes bacterium]|nr:branched-chain amino acid ABC transporter substrate-binding protein [Candidatus Aminicenantes bacterium]
MKRNIWIGIGIVVVVALAILLIVTQTKNEPKEIKIGVILPLTGEGAVYGEPQRRAAELAVEDINNKGGLLGKKVTLLAQDDKAQPADAVNIAHLFTSRNDIIGVIGYPNSGNAIPASKIFHSRKMPYVATSPTNPILTQQGFENVFRFAPTDNMQGISGAEFIFNRLKDHSIVIIHDNASYGKGIATQVKEHFESLGGNVLLSEALIPGERDYRGVLLMAKSYKPEAIFYGGMMPEGSILVRQAEELGLKIVFVFGDGCFDEHFKKLAGTNCRNVYISFLSPPWEAVPTAKEFVQKYKARYGPIPPFAPYGYDAILVLAEGINRAKSLDHEKIIQALRDPGFVVQGVTGEIKFDQNGQTTGRRFYFYTFNEQGKLVLYE